MSARVRPGDKFPSTRVLSQELRINPNTAQKIVSALVADGVLVTTPAKGSVIAEPEFPARTKALAILGEEIERFLVEARRHGLEEDDVHNAVAAHWRKLEEAAKKYFQR